MIEIEDSVLVSQPRSAVFRFAARPENMPLWNPVVHESRVEGRLGAGATVVQAASLLGRRFETVYTVTRYEPGRRIVYTSTRGAMDIRGTMEFRSERGGTLIRWVVCGDCRGFLRAAEGVILGAGRREMHACLANLKRLLDAQAA